jgi:hypothetical protein
MVHCINPCLCSLFLNFSTLQTTSRYYPPLFLFTLFIVSIISFAFVFFFVIPIKYLIILLHVLPLDSCGSSLNLVSFSSVTYVHSTQFLLLSNCSLGCRENNQINSDCTENWITSTNVLFNFFGVITQNTNVTKLILVVLLVYQFFFFLSFTDQHFIFC